MRTLFSPAQVDEIKQRLQRLHPGSPRQWGSMNPAQALAHCTLGIATVTGELRPPRLLIGRILGPLVKSVAFRDHEPMRRNVATAQCLIVTDERDFDTERDRLCAAIDRMAAAGPGACTTHPHIFFGPLTPDEWGILTYKHLDHHLRQFGV